MSKTISTAEVVKQCSVSPEWLSGYVKKGWLPSPMLVSYAHGGSSNWWPKNILSQISFIKTLRSCGKSTSEIHKILEENGMLYLNKRKEEKYVK